jgi:enoyl-CoA hydratase
LAVPSICALQGNLYGGGIDLALACDFRIGVPTIRMSLPAARLGIHLYPGALRRYVTRLGLGPAKRLCLLGATLDPDQLLRIGFLDDIADAARLHGAVAAMARAIAQGAPLPVRGMKMALNGYANGNVNEQAVAARFRASFASADLLEGLRAKAEGREPVFTGR